MLWFRSCGTRKIGNPILIFFIFFQVVGNIVKKKKKIYIFFNVYSLNSLNLWIYSFQVSLDRVSNFFPPKIIYLFPENEYYLLRSNISLLTTFLLQNQFERIIWKIKGIILKNLLHFLFFLFPSKHPFHVQLRHIQRSNHKPSVTRDNRVISNIQSNLHPPSKKEPNHNQTY